MNAYNDTPQTRDHIIHTMLSMVNCGLNKGASGNVSVRVDGGLLITPTGIPAPALITGDIVKLNQHGEAASGQRKPSSEWRMHADIYAAKADVQAIVHCHSAYATIVACAGREIPAVHYMVAAAGGNCIPIAAYARYGTAELSDHCLHALTHHSACLMANHGQLATGTSLESALDLAERVEEQAHCYWGTLAIGGPVLLGEGQMKEVLDAFSSYGQQNPGTST